MTKIQWVVGPDGVQGESWNYVVGCRPKSPGCTNCYAKLQAWRNEQMIPGLIELGKNPGRLTAYKGLATRIESGPHAGTVAWTGQVNWVSDAVNMPARKMKPTAWFVNSMSDLGYAQSQHFDTLGVLFGMAIAHSRHIYQALTKYPELILAYLKAIDGPGVALELWQEALERHGVWTGALAISNLHSIASASPNPLGSLWLGITTEDQARFNDRIGVLREIHGILNDWGLGGTLPWLSVEPMIGPLDITSETDLIRWVVAGFESQQGSIEAVRPGDLAWLRSLRDQCADHRVAYFVKQLGTLADGTTGKGGDWDEWVDAGAGDLMVRQMPWDLEVAPHGSQPKDMPGGTL